MSDRRSTWRIKRGRAADQGSEVLGGHVGHGSADRGMRGVFVLGRREVEIEQKRLPLGADQDVRGLDVAVQNAPLVRVVQPVGELSHDPRGRALVAQLAQSRRRAPRLLPQRIHRAGGGSSGDAGSATVLVFPLKRRGPRGLDRLQGEHQLLAGDRSRRFGPELRQNGREARPSQVGHADGTQARALIFVERIDRDDVGVQQLRERLGLFPFDGRDLEHDGPAGQVGLLRQEHPAERPLPEGQAQTEAEDLVPHLGQAERESPAVALSPQSSGRRFPARVALRALASARESVARIPPG